jgi:peptidyl-prolyl cis-trans isomerase B (cyclophilin B)
VEKNIMVVILHTNFGNISITLNPEKAPKTVENFLGYVRSGHYDGTIFHRVINQFMIQGGGFEPGLKLKPTVDPVKNEADNGLQNVRYSIAMARTNDPHSATCQFFININDNHFLDYPGQDGWGYTVFGMVTEGQEFVSAIGEVQTGRSGMHSDVPTEDVVISKAEEVIIKAKKARAPKSATASSPKPAPKKRKSKKG